MDGLSILVALTSANNRATEAFKMVLRDNSFPIIGQISEEWRRFFTLLFSILFGIASFFALGNTVSFDGTWLEPFADNSMYLNVLGGFSVSVVSGVVQPLIDRLSERGDVVVMTPTDEVQFEDVHTAK
jgi:hypothetical protein